MKREPDPAGLQEAIGGAQAARVTGAPLFDRILVANRGEIACRIIKTAQRLGIEAVAVYSEADEGAVHVAMADDAICIGAGPARASYLDMTRVLDACRQSGAQAVHPGYGAGYSGMLPCLRGGFCWRLVLSISSARMTVLRVSSGRMTSSM